MDRKELSEESIKLGKKVLVGLDKAKFPVTTAFWFLDAESTSWRYIVASKLLDDLGPIEAYGKLQKQLLKILGKNSIFIKNVSIVSPAHPLINLLKIAVRTEPTWIGGIRFTGNVINGQYIDDAYLYRVS
ncbi:MAG TPA: hypothetical protein VFB59_00165 [Candidatus Saccharimonadales bacterium]|nr:hypothetical protein [Candidatus Saccharimonadales bacterium]